jgi:hypothetical protein
LRLAIDKVGKDLFVPARPNGLAQRRKFGRDVHEFFVVVGEISDQQPSRVQSGIDAREIRNRIVNVLEELKGKAQINRRQLRNRGRGGAIEERQWN